MSNEKLVDPNLSAAIENADIFALTQAVPEPPSPPPVEEKAIPVLQPIKKVQVKDSETKENDQVFKKPIKKTQVKSSEPKKENEVTSQLIKKARVKSPEPEDDEVAEKPANNKGWLYAGIGILAVLFSIGFWIAVPLLLNKDSQPKKQDVALQQQGQKDQQPPAAINPIQKDKNEGGANNPPIPVPQVNNNDDNGPPNGAPAGQPKAPGDNQQNKPRKGMPDNLRPPQPQHGGVQAAPNLPVEENEPRAVKAIFVSLPKPNQPGERTNYNRPVILASELPILGSALSSFIDKTLLKVKGFEKEFRIATDNDALIFSSKDASGKFQPFGRMFLTGKLLQFAPLTRQGIDADDVEMLLQALAIKVSTANDATDILFFVQDKAWADFEKGIVVDELKEKMTLKSIEHPNDAGTYAGGTIHVIPKDSTVAFLQTNIFLAPEIRKMLTFSAACDEDKTRLVNSDDQTCNDDIYSLQITSGDFLRPDKARIKYSITCNEAKIKACLELKKTAMNDEIQQAKAEEMEQNLKKEIPTKVEMRRIVVMGKIKDTEFELWRLDSDPAKKMEKPKLGAPKAGTAH